jgi:hypothetical protein
MRDEVTEPSQQDRVPPPTTSPRSLSTRPAPDKASPEQHVVQIASQRSEADVLAVFCRLQQEQPALFSQATLSRSECSKRCECKGRDKSDRLAAASHCQ